MDVDLELPYMDLPSAYKDQVFYGSNGRVVTLSYENTNGRKGEISRPVEGVVNTMHRLLLNKASKSITHIEPFLKKSVCHRCLGERLANEGRFVEVHETRYPKLLALSIEDLIKWSHTSFRHLTKDKQEKVINLYKPLLVTLSKLKKVGLAYLSVDRAINTLSGGEAQRVKLASQFSSELSGILYILDEPSKGLHAKDYKFLFETIIELKEKGNTVIIVEHNKDFLACSDYHLTIGPKAGKYGGEIVEFTPVDQVNKSDFDTCYITEKQAVDKGLINCHNLDANNLKDVSVSIPIAKMTSVIGVSGSGKSSLIAQSVLPLLEAYLGDGLISKQLTTDAPILGVEYISQKAIGRNSRSNPATYIGLFDEIRKLYAKLPEVKTANLSKEHFSFNSKKGQCDVCSGLGETPVSAHFMKDYFTTCGHCHGQRYKEEVLAVRFKGHSISDVLNMEVREAFDIFEEDTAIHTLLESLMRVGLDYIKLGQSGSTLSGGESQRMKLAKALTMPNSKDWVYILDEPSTGLHEDDVSKLIHVFKKLTESGHTVIIIEHNKQVIKSSDYIIEMGPAGGSEGGYVLQEGILKNNS